MGQMNLLLIFKGYCFISEVFLKNKNLSEIVEQHLWKRMPKQLIPVFFPFQLTYFYRLLKLSNQQEVPNKYSYR